MTHQVTLCDNLHFRIIMRSSMVMAIRSTGKNNNNFRNLIKTASQIAFFLQSCFISSKWQYTLMGMYTRNATVLKHGPRILDTLFHLELESMSPCLCHKICDGFD